MVPPPPGRFSSTNGWLTCFETCSSVMRPIRSLALPAVNGLTTSTERTGQFDCAEAVVAASSIAASAPASLRNEAIHPSLDFGTGCALGLRPASWKTRQRLRDAVRAALARFPDPHSGFEVHRHELGN